METPPHEMRLGDTEEDYYRLGLQEPDAPPVPSEGGGRSSVDDAVKKEKAAKRARKGGEGK
jgi:NADH-quinone oxidoreductase subunit I